MKWLKQLFRTDLTRVTVENPLVIESPRIAFLNLIGPSADSLLYQDKAAVASLFASIEEGGSQPPTCDVLMIYCDLQKDGVIAGHSKSLREIIDDAKAAIVIVGSENSADAYTAAGKPTGRGRANLVMTLKRNGPAFTSFFTALFRRMFAGQSMLRAWVELAPQIPGATHDNCPETIFAAELSHVVFRAA